MSYKKRARAGWTGKKEAKTKIYKERQHGKKEIDEAQEQILQGDDFRYKGSKKKKPTKEQKVDNEIRWLEGRVEYWRRPNIQNSIHDSMNSWIGRTVIGYEYRLKKLKDEKKKNKNKS